MWQAIGRRGSPGRDQSSRQCGIGNSTLDSHARVNHPVNAVCILRYAPGDFGLCPDINAVRPPNLDNAETFLGPRWAIMWLVALVLYSAAKLLCWRSSRHYGILFWKQAAFLLAWPGMDSDTFLHSSAKAIEHPVPAEWLTASLWIAAGFTLLYGIAPAVPAGDASLAGWLGMISHPLILHFGLFRLLSCLWRCCGCQATPLMNRPLAAQSLTEFWGRRWNLAFRDLTHRFVFRPLYRRLNPSLALLAGFFISGLIHDLVISVPAGAGYGLPTLYFVLQGVGVLLERSRAGRRMGLRYGLVGHLFCALVLIAPVSLLFHESFVTRVILPMLHAIGSLP